MISSAKPSEKYSFSLSGLRLAKGSTAMEGVVSSAAASRRSSRASLRSMALWNRCSGSLRMQRATRRSMSRGVCGDTSFNGRGSLCRIAAIVEIGVSPLKAFRRAPSLTRKCRSACPRCPLPPARATCSRPCLQSRREPWQL